MIKKYKNKKELIITDPSKFPDDFWNYWVNPILGYYVPKTRSKVYVSKAKNKENENEN